MNTNSHIHFCSHCHNLTSIGVKEDTSLVHYCKGCNQEEVFDPSDHCIYTMSFKDTDMKHTLNQNKYVTHDITLPKIQGNPNIKCMNEACESHTQGVSSVTYLKHDSTHMKYMYICDTCGQSWTNE
jgi:hypothetical protein